MAKKMCKFFVRDWWDAVLHAWNDSPYTSELAGLGLVCFRIQQELETEALQPIYVHWDSVGVAKHHDFQTSDSTAIIPCFTAPDAVWEAFVRGEFSATMGVLRGLIRFEGPLNRVLPYTIAFNRLAKVANTTQSAPHSK